MDGLVDIAHATLAQFGFDLIFVIEDHLQIRILVRFGTAHKRRAIIRTMAQFVLKTAMAARAFPCHASPYKSAQKTNG
jgi:hypothetical protein